MFLKHSLFCLCFLIACMQNPVEKKHEDHVEPVGFQIKHNDNILVDHPDNSLLVSDSITVNLNDTLELELFFYDESGNLFNPLHHDEADHEEGEDHSLSFSFLENGLEKSTSNYLAIAVEDEHAHEESEEANHLVVAANSVGATKVKILILHGNHPDFEATPIKFVVKDVAGKK